MHSSSFRPSSLDSQEILTELTSAFNVYEHSHSKAAETDHFKSSYVLLILNDDNN